MILHQIHAFPLTLVELSDIGWPVQVVVIAVHVFLLEGWVSDLQACGKVDGERRR